MIRIELMNRSRLAWAQWQVQNHHYLKTPVDSRCSVEGYQIHLDHERFGDVVYGVLLFGRPEATRCYPWYGSIEDLATGRAEVTRWQVLNLARVWLDPTVQPGGALFRPDCLPGFTDRSGRFRSTLASEAIKLACQQIGFDYLMARPPLFSG